jgi:hypothetical protein
MPISSTRPTKRTSLPGAPEAAARRKFVEIRRPVGEIEIAQCEALLEQIDADRVLLGDGEDQVSLGGVRTRDRLDVGLSEQPAAQQVLNARLEIPLPIDAALFDGEHLTEDLLARVAIALEPDATDLDDRVGRDLDTDVEAAGGAGRRRDRGRRQFDARVGGGRGLPSNVRSPPPCGRRDPGSMRRPRAAADPSVSPGARRSPRRIRPPPWPVDRA